MGTLMLLRRSAWSRVKLQIQDSIGRCVLFLELLHICTLSTDVRCMCIHVHHWSGTCIRSTSGVGDHRTNIWQHDLHQIYVSLDCLCILNCVVNEIRELWPGSLGHSKMDIGCEMKSPVHSPWLLLTSWSFMLMGRLQSVVPVVNIKSINAPNVADIRSSPFPNDQTAPLC